MKKILITAAVLGGAFSMMGVNAQPNGFTKNVGIYVDSKKVIVRLNRGVDKNDWKEIPGYKALDLIAKKKPERLNEVVRYRQKPNGPVKAIALKKYVDKYPNRYLWIKKTDYLASCKYEPNCQRWYTGRPQLDH